MKKKITMVCSPFDIKNRRKKKN